VNAVLKQRAIAPNVAKRFAGVPPASVFVASVSVTFVTPRFIQCPAKSLKSASYLQGQTLGFLKTPWQDSSWQAPKWLHDAGRMVLLGVLLLGLWVGLGAGGAAQAGPLGDRLSQFPDWQGKPLLPSAKGDLAYPDWFEGTWDVTTTLVDLAAPLAPEIVTPGFEGNRQYLNQPVPFQARFVATLPNRFGGLPLPPALLGKPQIVADRAFNGLNLAKAYLDKPDEKSPVLAVKVDPKNPNRQITLLRDESEDSVLGAKELVSTVVARGVETPDPLAFVTTEVFQQEFLGAPQIYFNTVETSTAYELHPDELPRITADQVTAIYLSPQDPDFFAAGDRPVALYRYRLEFSPELSPELSPERGID
jgi:hypothetical protein